MKRFKEWGLLPKVLIAIALGIICSFFFPDWLVRCFVTINSIFSNFLGLFIPIIILGLIAPGIFELGKGAGKLLLITAAIAYASTILAGLFSYGTCRATYPSLLGDALTSLGNIDMESNDLKYYFTIDMPPLMSVTTSLVLAFVIGLSLIGIKGDTFRNVMLELRELVFLVIRKVIIPILPVFIFGVFLEMGAEGNVGPVLGMFLKIILIIFAMHVTVLVLQFCIAGAIAHRNPFKALVTMLPAYVTALGTQSSAATIPVTRAQAIKNGVDPDVADFVVPLCATIHMSCSMLKIVACALAISMSMHLDFSFATYAGFILMLGITMIAAPGVPGGAIMAALGLLASMLGFDANMQGLMIALYIAMDSFGTAGNVTGDGAIALIINKIKLKGNVVGNA
ncbi:MAG: dicarboxylate/amino acid:cation symporter [Bacteroidales bacterium]|nr:dicarboxylate/amino acid:cation symporter [Bacteroidales bacterium]MBR6211486.1 dicarboxylate/amino acid:cation symporter [Bacteroidales bacterium]MBR6270263.1 dicarboxylate/amino acid:cation symporter [Bacteroidales bacterium]